MSEAKQLLPEVLRSVPMDAKTGRPMDASLREASGFNLSAQEPVAATGGEIPAFAPTRPREDWDHPAFDHAALPLPGRREEEKLAEVYIHPSQSGNGAASAKVKPTVRYLGARPVSRVMELSDPLEVDGVEYHRATISSPMGSKFSEYASHLQEYGAENAVMWLVVDLPIDVVANLSFDDKMELNEIGLPFLPRRMRENIRAAQEAQTAAQTTASSDTPGQGAA